MFLRNERGLGAAAVGRSGGRDGVAVNNGTLGTVLEVAAKGERLTVRLDRGGADAKAGEVVTFDVREYGHVDHGYASTVHKAQGVTVDRAHVLAMPMMDRHAAYVELTRHRESVAVHYGVDDFADAGKLARALGRERTKDTTLDYGMGNDAGQDMRQGAGQSEAADLEVAARRYAERELETGQWVTQVVVEDSVPAAAKPVPSAELAESVAQGRARFREGFATYQRQQAQKADDEVYARELVERWDQAVSGLTATLPRLDIDPAYGPARKVVLEFGRELTAQPGAVAVLRERGDAFGMKERPTLAGVMADAQPERAVGAIMEGAETKIRAQLQERAQQRTAENEARRQEKSYQPQLAPSRRPSMGM